MVYFFVAYNLVYTSLNTDLSFLFRKKKKKLNIIKCSEIRKITPEKILNLKGIYCLIFFKT